MNDTYPGQIALFACAIVPAGWAACNGQMLDASSYPELFQLIGTRFGSDAPNHFALPNLAGAFALGAGAGYPLGQSGGEAKHQLTLPEMPVHYHMAVGSLSEGTSLSPVGMFPGASSNALPYSQSVDTGFGEGSSPSGDDQPHNNLPPFLALNFCIALSGDVPINE